MSTSRNVGVLIGRFQPTHNGHLKLITDSLKRVDMLIILIGSAQAFGDIRNPFDVETRKDMLFAALRAEGVNLKNIHIGQVNDHHYNDLLWRAEVQQAVNNKTNRDDSIWLIGCEKDFTTTYLRGFPQWQRLDSSLHGTLSATEVRSALLSGQDVSALVPAAVATLLGNMMDSPEGQMLKQEYRAVSDYHASWSHAPYPPTFLTTDAVAFRSGHVLAIQRGVYPGKGKLALPGGFVEQNETLLAGCVRELSEETGLGARFEGRDWVSYLNGQQVFDHPLRSTRGRTVTQAFCFNLGNGELPHVRGQDDASSAQWIPIHRALGSPQMWFEDHHSILEHFALSSAAGNRDLYGVG